MSNNKHTETPWHMQKDSVHVYGPDGGMVANTIAACSGDNHRENAQHIVKCVNMHDELVEALKNDAARFKGIIEKLSQWNSMTGNQRAVHLESIWHYECECLEVVKKASVLEKVKGLDI